MSIGFKINEQDICSSIDALEAIIQDEERKLNHYRVDLAIYKLALSAFREVNHEK